MDMGDPSWESSSGYRGKGGEAGGRRLPEGGGGFFWNGCV